MGAVDLEARVAALPCWRGKASVEPLAGGLSNAAFVVRDGHDRYVARCGSDIPVHHVFRDRELAVSRAAHAAGLSPEVVYAAPGVMVLRHIDGCTFVESDLREATWAMVSAHHLRAPGADYAAHAAEYVARTETMLARYTERHGSLAGSSGAVLSRAHA